MAIEPYKAAPTIQPEFHPAPEEHPEVTPQMFGAQIGAAEERAGAQLEGAGEEVNRVALDFQQMNNATYALNASTAASKELGQAEVQFRQLQGQNAVDGFPAFQQTIQDIQSKYAGQFTAPKARLAFLQDFRGYADRALFNSGAHVADQAVKAHTGAITAAIEEEQSAATRNAVTTGQAPNFDKIVALNAQLGQTMGWSKDQVDASIQQTSSKMVNDVISGYIASANPNNFNRADRAAAFYKQMLGQTIPGTNLPVLNGQAIDTIGAKIQSTQWMDQARQEAAQRRAEAAQDKYAAQLRVHLDHSVETAVTMLKNGDPVPPNLIPSDSQIDAAFPRNPEMAAEAKEKVASVRLTDQYIPMVRTATDQQIMDAEAKLRPDPNNPSTYLEQSRRYNAFKEAVTTRDAQLKKDPVSYIIGGDPHLQTQYQAAVKDPNLFGPYAQSILGTQATMGVPEAARHVLPEKTAQAIVQSIVANPNQAADKIKELQKDYGAGWQPLWKDLVTLGKLPAGFQAVGDIPDPQQAAWLARALTPVKSGEKALGELVPPGMKTGPTGIDELVSAQSQQFLHALDGAGASDQMKAGMLDSVRKLAYANMVYGGAPDAGTAVQKAVGAFTGHYTFLPNGGAMIPTDRLDSVSANMAATLQRLPQMKVNIPAIYGQPGQPSKDDYLRTLAGAPIWKTSPQGDSVLLYDPEGRLVRQTDGNPISVRFDAPTPLSAQTPPLNTLGGG